VLDEGGGVEIITREVKEKSGAALHPYVAQKLAGQAQQFTLERFRDALRKEGIGRIAIAVKARPDSITRESIAVLDDLGLFRVFLGVENASETGLRNLNRKSCVAEIMTNPEPFLWSEALRKSNAGKLQRRIFHRAELLFQGQRHSKWRAASVRVFFGLPGVGTTKLCQICQIFWL